MKTVATVSAVLVVLVVLPASAQSGRFVDDDGRPAEQALEWLAEKDVIDGCDPPSNTRSCPDEQVSRVQAAKVLVRLAREEGILAGERPGVGDHFSDDDTVWSGAAEPFTNHLADLRIVHGCDPPTNRSFCPHDTLLRGQITKMVVRTFDLDAPPGYQTPWRDTEGHFFHEAARVAAYHGLLDSSAGFFDGHRAVSRGEFARIVVAVADPDLCADDPFSAGRVADLETDNRQVSFTAYVYDFDSGCAYGMNPANRLPTASVFKVMVMAGSFVEAQEAGRELTSSERSWLEQMITESADPPVRELWRSFGGAPWFGRQAEIFELAETDVVGDYQPGWGHTTTSGYDQGQMLRQVLVEEGGVVQPGSQAEAFDLMTSVVSWQSWGVTAGVPAGWTVAQKNGFAGQTTNSVGIVYDADQEPEYAVAILSHGWPAWQQGVPAVERIASWVSSTLAD
jgi:hypothetical protein